MKNVYDVIIVGAGSSGMNAAICAARKGLQVLLIDQNGYPGGTNTSAMVGPFMTFHDGEKQVVKGIAQEIIDRLAAKGGTLGHVPDPIGVVASITPVDSELLKQVYFEMLAEEKNITTLLHTFLVDSDVRSNTVRSVRVVNKSGMQTFEGKIFIDASGDADLAAACGADFVVGRKHDGMAQPMTLMFGVENVDLQETVAYVHQNPEQFILNKDCDLTQYLAVSGFFSLVEQARKNGDFPLPRDRVLFFQGVHPGEVIINMTRVTKLSGVNGDDRTEAEIQAHKQVDIVMAFLKKYIPGFANARIKAIASATGVRESRRLVGVETLDTDMIFNSQENDNSVAVCAYPIDIHDPVGAELNWIRKGKGCYDVPYGVMVPKKITNLLVTGRCISASHEAMASVRITPTAMALGQAAGMAASIAATEKTSVQAIDVQKLQNLLWQDGAIPGKRWL